METPAGEFVVKLRGAAQGVLPLVSEVLVGEIATRLGLSVPERVVVALEPGVPAEDRSDELADLLARSTGENLGFRFLPGSTDLGPDQLPVIEPEVRARILWLDGLVSNPDRTVQNPNVLLWHRQPWLIDHGACLSFHHDLARVTESSPREPFDTATHLFHADAASLRDVDAACAAALSRDVLTEAARRIPDSFLSGALGSLSPSRARAAYVAFLWKRLKAPRPFVPA